MLPSLTIPMFCIHHQKIGGVESAVYNLVRGLDLAGGETRIITGPLSRLSPDFVHWLCQSHRVKRIAGFSLPGPKGLRFLEEFVFDLTRLASEWVLYPNYFNPRSLLNSTTRNLRTAALLHDIQFKTLPDYHSSRRRRWLDFCIPKMLENTDLPIVISNSEKNMIAEYYGADLAERCEVLPNPVDWSRYEIDANDNAQPDSSRPYVLSVFHPFPHKNLITLIRAFSLLCEFDRDHELLLVGKQTPESIDVIQNHASRKAMARLRLTGFVSDADLGRLYRGASLFVLPSLYEGFGIPPVEAMGFGVDTIVSRSTALPEVTLNLAVYVDQPTSPELWFEIIRDRLQSRVKLSSETVATIRAHYDPERIAMTLLAQMSRRG